MKKILILTLLVMVGIFAVSQVGAAEDIAQDNSSDAEIISVPQVEDSLTEDNCDVEIIEKENDDDLMDSGEGSYRSIQEQIDSAKPGETVNLTGSTYYCDYLINVNKTLTIDGKGSTLIFDGSDKDYTSPFFYINHTSNVVLKNIKFVDGNCFFGGALSWEGDNGIISGCEFISNLARQDKAIGGAILMLGNNCSVVNSTFINNQAHEFGGAIVWYGPDGTIDNCKFIGNEALANYRGQGGALVLVGDNCTVINSNFTQNSCTFFGGAISVSNSTNSRIINCNFDGNYIQNTPSSISDIAGGGAIFSACFGLVIDKCNFTNNHVNATGGALHLSDNDIVTNSFFNKNYAIKDELGYEYGNDIAYFGTPSVYKNNIRSNTFVLDYGEIEQHAVGINEYPEMFEEILSNNQFIHTKLNSTVSFSAGIIFDYNTASSPIQIIVVGGTVAKENITVLGHPEANIMFSNNELSVSNLPVGNFILTVTTTPYDGYLSASSNITVIVNKATAVISASSANVVLKKSSYWDIKLIDSKSKKPITNMKLTLKVFTGNKYSVLTVTTDSKGVAHFKTSSLTAGKHKMVVSGTHAGYKFNTITSYITVIKPTALKFKVYKRDNSKNGALISFQVLNKKTKKPVNGVKVKFLIKTGKKYITITHKTKTVKKNGKKYKGITGFFSNKFSVGKHVVKIEPVSMKYSGSGKSSIVIKKSAKNYPPRTTKV